MRLLAVTAGDDAQGRITEADEVVGQITVGGTIGFVVFTALFFGAATGGGYLWCALAARPPAGGLAYGPCCSSWPGHGSNPCAKGNLDFDLVGPGLGVGGRLHALVLFHGMLVAALAGRVSRAVPLLARQPRAIAAHAPLCCSPRWRPWPWSWPWWARGSCSRPGPPGRRRLARPPPRPGRPGGPGPGRPGGAARLPLRRRRTSSAGVVRRAQPDSSSERVGQKTVPQSR